MEKKVFIGSSSKTKNICTNIGTILERLNITDIELEPIKWFDLGTFTTSNSTFDELIRIAKEVDAALFIFNSDDKVTNKEGNEKFTTRGNVVLEYGLFSGILGKDKVAMIKSGNPELPTDMDGIKYIEYNEGRSNTFTEELRLFLEKAFKEPPIIPAIPALIVDTDNKAKNKRQRDSKFEELRHILEEEDDYYVMGMGVTSFLRNTDIVEQLLIKGIHITVLLMSVKLIKDTWDCAFQCFYNDHTPGCQTSCPYNDAIMEGCPSSLFNFLIDKDHFLNYQGKKHQNQGNRNTVERDLYMTAMEEALKYCPKYKETAESLKRTDRKVCSFEYYQMFSFYPLSMTAVKKKTGSGSRLIVEYIVPFTDKRILLDVSEEEHKDIFDLFINFFENTLKSSRSKGKTIEGKLIQFSKNRI